MGMFDRLKLQESHKKQLPKWDRPLEKAEGWQTKDIGQPVMDVYKISEDGRLLRKDERMREMTDEEKQEQAEEYGFDSWQALEEAHEKALDEDNGSEALAELGNDDSYIPPILNEKVVDEINWVDQEQHGSFEFHTTVHGDRIDEVTKEREFREYWSYEARFRDGEFEEFIHLKTVDCKDED